MPLQSFPCRLKIPGNYDYNLTVEYQDDYGMHSKTERLTMTVLDGNGTGLLIAVILLLVAAGGAGYWYFILRKKGTGNV